VNSVRNRGIGRCGWASPPVTVVLEGEATSVFSVLPDQKGVLKNG
jgi:hypothetical protein